VLEEPMQMIKKPTRIPASSDDAFGSEAYVNVGQAKYLVIFIVVSF
jgi:hypothetical protein